MQTKLRLCALLATFVLATLLAQSAHAYENSQYGFSINPPGGWALEERTQPELFVFRDPSNYTGATISVLVNQSGLPQEDPALHSRTEGILRRYLAQTYKGYLISDKGTRVVGSLNGYQIKFDASVNGSSMRFVSVIFVLTNQTFFIVCGAASPSYDNLSSVFKESIDSFRLIQTVNKSIPNSNVAVVLVGAVVVVAVVAVAAVVYLRKRRS